jgi:hypothetical protein
MTHVAPYVERYLGQSLERSFGIERNAGAQDPPLSFVSATVSATNPGLLYQIRKLSVLGGSPVKTTLHLLEALESVGGYVCMRVLLGSVSTSLIEL